MAQQWRAPIGGGGADDLGVAQPATPSTPPPPLRRHYHSKTRDIILISVTVVLTGLVAMAILGAGLGQQ
eukprot:376875-Amphidinium_carterae.1